MTSLHPKLNSRQYSKPPPQGVDTTSSKQLLNTFSNLSYDICLTSLSVDCKWTPWAPPGVNRLETKVGAPWLLRMSSPFRCFKTSPEINRLAVMLDVRFPLSLRKCGRSAPRRRHRYQPRLGVHRYSDGTLRVVPFAHGGAAELA